MLVQEVARKYALALFMSVRERKLLDLADTQFLALGEALRLDHMLLHFLEAPQIPDDKKLALIHDVFATRLDPHFVEFLYVLFRKHRIRYLAEIIEEFDRLVKAEKGIGKVTVITAVKLSPSEEQALIKELKARTGLTIELDARVDPAILGGMITILHDHIIDGSVRRALDLLREQLEKVKVA
jgi:F-type H+-transporting ATPase subunit delta